MSKLHSDLFSQLKAEHDDVKKLLHRALKEKEINRGDILDDIKSHLIPHARAEEKTLYAVLLEEEVEGDLQDLIKEAYTEHEEVDGIIEELEALEGNATKWRERMAVLQENVLHHVKEEEEQVFDKASAYISKDLSQKMLELYQREKQRFQSQQPSQAEIESRKPAKTLAELRP